MTKWALITGSTSGIGKSFSEVLAAEGYNLIAIARDEVQLDKVSEQLKEMYAIQVVNKSVDLANQTDIQNLVDFISESQYEIEVLVNNAGFGINRNFLESDLKDQTAMINCMIMAPMQLTYAVAKKMIYKKSGFIINVSSVAGFMSGSTYCSAKSWLNNFSETLYQDLKGSNVNLHVVCPGFTKTDFHRRCNQDVSGVPNYFWLNPDLLATKTWRYVKDGRLISIPKFHYKILVMIHQFAPRRIVILYGRVAKTFLRRNNK